MYFLGPRVDTETTYIGLVPPALPIQYVGRVLTADKEKRYGTHLRNKGFVPYYEINNLTKAQARGLEEMGMMAMHTLTGIAPNNVIGGVSLINKNREFYLTSGFDAYLKNKAEEAAYHLLDDLQI